jgi:cytochrome b6-f complex iron-sulfur subunit
MASTPLEPAEVTPFSSPGAGPDGQQREPAHGEEPSRRDLLGTALNTGVVLSLGVSYGTLAAHAVKFLVPEKSEEKAWLYVAQCRGIALGGQLKYTAPSGATIAVARLAEGDRAESFIALSSTCPHMGCQVLWEGGKSRFFCPCHNGVFNARGEGTDGPPKGQSLARYPIQVEDGLLFVEVPLTVLPRERGGSAQARRSAPQRWSEQGAGRGSEPEHRRLPVVRDGGPSAGGRDDEPA